MLNRITLVGRICKEIELRYSPSGVAIANFTLAVERNFKSADGQKETDFIPCVVFKQAAEYAANYIGKGKLASVDGRLQVRTYNDKDGQKHWVTEVVADSINGLSPRDDQQDNNNSAGQPTKGSFGHEITMDDGDSIPF